MPKAETSKIQPYIKGIGGCWGYGTNDISQQLLKTNEIGDDVAEPFFIQYERRMEYLRRKMIRE
jgi:hypothetical protein